MVRWLVGWLAGWMAIRRLVFPKYIVRTSYNIVYTLYCIPIPSECLNGHMKCMSSFVMFIDTLSSRRYKYLGNCCWIEIKRNVVGWLVARAKPKKRVIIRLLCWLRHDGDLLKKNFLSSPVSCFVVFFLFLLFSLFFLCLLRVRPFMVKPNI